MDLGKGKAERQVRALAGNQVERKVSVKTGGFKNGKERERGVIREKERGGKSEWKILSTII